MVQSIFSLLNRTGEVRLRPVHKSAVKFFSYQRFYQIVHRSRSKTRSFPFPDPLRKRASSRTLSTHLIVGLPYTGGVPSLIQSVAIVPIHRRPTTGPAYRSLLDLTRFWISRLQRIRCWPVTGAQESYEKPISIARGKTPGLAPIHEQGAQCSRCGASSSGTVTNSPLPAHRSLGVTS